MVTYFIPVIATAAGVALLGEQLSWNTPVGALIVLVGAALTQSAARAEAPPAPRPLLRPRRAACPPLRPRPSTPGAAPDRLSRN
ncbi:hypothetical protein SBADM41S_06712 [Streptomyces badius]